MSGLEMFMLIQGYEVGRKDFGDSVRDRIAFEVAFSQNCLCGSKDALLTLFYSAADSIIQVTNKEKSIWTPITETKPSPFAGALYRVRGDPGDAPWIVGLAEPLTPAEDIDNVQWRNVLTGKLLWPDGAEWMAIPL